MRIAQPSNKKKEKKMNMKQLAKKRMMDIFGSKDKTKKPNIKEVARKKSLAEQINFGGKNKNKGK